MLRRTSSQNTPVDRPTIGPVFQPRAGLLGASPSQVRDTADGCATHAARFCSMMVSGTDPHTTFFSFLQHGSAP
jgi:hypothetical protein